MVSVIDDYPVEEVQMARNLDALFELLSSIQVTTHESLGKLDIIGKELSRQIDDVRTRVTSVEGHVRAIIDDISGISGEHPLPVRMALLEQQSARLTAWREQDIAKRWQLTVLAISCVLGSLTALVVALFNWAVK